MSFARQSPLLRNARTCYPLSAIDGGMDILTLLASLRFATLQQIQRVIFTQATISERQARHRATRSVRRLFDSGYLRRVAVFAPSAGSGALSRQIVHVLSAKGATTVGIDPRWVRTRAPKDRHILSHDFWLVELAVLAMEGCPEPLSILTWWDDRILAGRKRQGSLTLGNIPDAYLLIENLSTGKRFPCLVELDLGTESVASPTRMRRDFTRKIEGYLGYIGADFRQDFAIDAPPIVLIITESHRRMESLRSTTQRLGGAGRFWFTTLSQLRAKTGQDGHFAGRQDPFWTSNWQTAHEDGLRSLATRCGV